MGEFILSEIDERGIARLTLQRPALRNAFNAEMIAEITTAFELYAENSAVRLVLLQGLGKSFCAGADLHWMKKQIEFSRAENIKDSETLAKMFATINHLAKPVIGRVHGHVLGGGAGLVAVCDYVIADKKTKFGFSEVLLGLIPAVISPYVIAKIGASHARATFLSGKTFDANKALHMGLIHEIEEGGEEIEYYLNLVLDNFLKAAPLAAAAAKKCIQFIVAAEHDSDKINAYTCAAIAERRVHPEGQEGMTALLEKRRASWVVNNEN